MAHDREYLGPQRPILSRVQAIVAFFRPNSRLSQPGTVPGHARIRKKGLIP